jgi:hypothetical protein
MIVYNKNIISWQAMDRIYQAIMNGVSQSSIRDQRMTSSVGAISDGKLGHAFRTAPSDAAPNGAAGVRAPVAIKISLLRS